MIIDNKREQNERHKVPPSHWGPTRYSITYLRFRNIKTMMTKRSVAFSCKNHLTERLSWISCRLGHNFSGVINLLFHIIQHRWIFSCFWFNCISFVHAANALSTWAILGKEIFHAIRTFVFTSNFATLFRSFRFFHLLHFILFIQFVLFHRRLSCCVRHSHFEILCKRCEIIMQIARWTTHKKTTHKLFIENYAHLVCAYWLVRFPPSFANNFIENVHGNARKQFECKIYLMWHSKSKSACNFYWDKNSLIYYRGITKGMSSEPIDERPNK